MSDPATLPGASICVSPLSSPYGLLPRAHTYALVVTLFLPLPRGWLFRAALASLTTRTAIAAIDALVLLDALKRHRAHNAPLDTLIATEYLALACVAAVFLLLRSRRAGESAAHGLVRAWAVAVGIGAIVGFVTLGLLGRWQDGDEESLESCTSLHGVVMSRDEFWSTDVELGAGLGVVGSKIAWFIMRVGVPGVLFAAFAFLASCSPRPSTDRWGPRVVEGAPHETYIQENAFSIWPKVGRIIGHIVFLACPAMAAFVAASAEFWIWRMVPEVPVVEGLSSPGQWGVWAATGVVVLATAINASKEQMGMSSGPAERDGLAVREESGPEIIKV